MRVLTLLPLLAQAAASNFVLGTACSALGALKFPNFQIRFTMPIIAGSNFTGDAPEPSFNAIQTLLPSACRVAAVVQTSENSSARFEIWLPTEQAWNSRFLATGNGGWAGGVNYPDIVTGLKSGMF